MRKMGKLRGTKRKIKDVTKAEEDFSDNEVPAKTRSSDDPVPKKVKNPTKQKIIVKGGIRFPFFWCGLIFRYGAVVGRRDS
jgi:hypothetical protein